MAASDEAVRAAGAGRQGCALCSWREQESYARAADSPVVNEPMKRGCAGAEAARRCSDVAAVQSRLVVRNAVSVCGAEGRGLVVPTRLAVV